MSEIRVRPSQQNIVKVRVGQQNATKVVSSATGTFIGSAGYALTSGLSYYSNYSGISSFSYYSGISSFSYYSDYSGISSFSNISSRAYYADVSGISSSSLFSNVSYYSVFSGQSNNLSGGFPNNLVYQSTSGVTSFVPQGSFGQVLYTNILGTPEWTFQPPAELVSGITVINQNEIVGFANSITTLRIVGIGLSANLGVTNNVANIEIIEIDGGEY